MGANLDKNILNADKIKSAIVKSKKKSSRIKFSDLKTTALSQEEIDNIRVKAYSYAF